MYFYFNSKPLTNCYHSVFTSFYQKPRSGVKMMQIIKRTVSAIAAGALLLSFVAPVYAGSSIVISGNGADSTNKVKVKSTQKVTVRQSNKAKVSNFVFAGASTGNNDANNNTGGNVTITTGDASASASVKNTFNSNIAIVCCDGDKPCDPQDPCHNETIWGHSIHQSLQGTLKDGNPITDPLRTDPNAAVGSPDGNFFSIGKNGWITVHFLDAVNDVVGNDLSFHEITNDRDTYPEEKAHVQVSFDGTTWIDAGDISGKDASGISYLDISGTGLTQVHFVKIIDTTDYSLHDNAADGYDLDAVDGMHKVCPLPV